MAEFYDQDTQALCVETPLTDAVISPEFVSMQLTHLAREPVPASIYREFYAGGIEIALRLAECYVPLGEELAFLRGSRRRNRRMKSLWSKIGSV